MEAQLWIIVLLSCLDMDAVTGFHDFSEDFSWNSFELPQYLGSDQFANDPLMYPAPLPVLDHEAFSTPEIEHQIESHTNPTSESPDFSFAVGTGTVGESNPSFHPGMSMQEILAYFQEAENLSASLSNNMLELDKNLQSGFDHSLPSTNSEPVAKSNPMRSRIASLNEFPPKKSRKIRTPGPRVRRLEGIFTEYFTLVDFEPSTICGNVAVEAIMNLKKADGKKLIDIDVSQEKVQKMIILGPSQHNKDEFFWYAYVIMHDGKTPVENSQSNMSEDKISIGKGKSTWRENKKRRSSLREALKLFSSQIPKITLYKTELMKGLSEDQQILTKKVNEKFRQDVKILDTQMRILGWALHLLPLYLFHVDMINLIIPTGNLSDGNLLESQRKVAANAFFEFMGRILLEDVIDLTHPSETDVIKNKIVMFSTSQMNKCLDTDTANSVLWKALQYWFLSSRIELLTLNKNQILTEAPTYYFKAFFKDLLLSWIENLS